MLRVETDVALQFACLSVFTVLAAQLQVVLGQVFCMPFRKLASYAPNL
jgi:hypothetical protein